MQTAESKEEQLQSSTHKHRHKDYVIPTLEDLVRMSYPEFASCKITTSDITGGLTVKDGSFSAPYANLKYQHFFNPQRFREFVHHAHCSENLQFLIDIHLYSQIWDDLARIRGKDYDTQSVLSCNWKRILPSEKLQKTFSQLELARHFSGSHHKASASLDVPLSPTDVMSSFSSFAPKSTPNVAISSVSSPVRTQLSTASSSAAQSPVPFIPDSDKLPSSTSPSASDRVSVISSNAASAVSSAASNLNESFKNLDLNDVNSIVDLDQYNRSISSKNAEAGSGSAVPSNAIFGMDVNVHAFPDLTGSDASSVKSGSSASNKSTSSKSSSSSSLIIKEEKRIKHELKHCWNDIINTYCKKNSVCELNLPNEIIHSVMIEDGKKRIHNPKALLKAKKLVLSLLRQNVYWQFIRSAESDIAEQESRENPSKFSNSSVLDGRNVIHNSKQINNRRGPAGIVFYGTDEGVMCADSRVPMLSPAIASPEPHRAGFLRFYGRSGLKRGGKTRMKGRKWRRNGGLMSGQLHNTGMNKTNDKSINSVDQSVSAEASVSSFASTLSSETSSSTMIRRQGWPHLSHTLSQKTNAVFDFVPRLLGKQKARSAEGVTRKSPHPNTNSSTSSTITSKSSLSSRDNLPVDLSAVKLIPNLSSSSALSDRVKLQSGRIFHHHMMRSESADSRK